MRKTTAWWAFVVAAWLCGERPCLAEPGAGGGGSPERSETTRGEDSTGSGEDQRIPEPLLFDLARELGTHAGEVEVSSLFLSPVRKKPGVLRWGPQIEVGVAEGYALELELACEGNQVLGPKVALQGTVATMLDRRMIHGWQAYVEHESGAGKTSLTALYVLGYRLNHTYSTLFTAGGRAGREQDVFETEPKNRGDVVVTGAFFAELGKVVVVGAEVDFEASPTAHELSFVAMPQGHLRLGEHWEIEAGVGVQSLPSEKGLLGALRVLIEP